MGGSINWLPNVAPGKLAASTPFWVAAERLPMLAAIYPGRNC